MRHGRLLVHVGYPKTGTTSLQRALSLERAALLSQGILYPTATTALPEFGHHNIYWEAAGDERYDPGNGGLDDLLDEVRSIAPQDVVISSEALISLLLDFPERLGTLLEGLSQYRPTIVVGVRRLDEYVESLFRHQFNAWVWDRPIRRSTEGSWRRFERPRRGRMRKDGWPTWKAGSSRRRDGTPPPPVIWLSPLVRTRAASCLARRSSAR